MVCMVYNGMYGLQWCVWFTMVCMVYNGVYGLQWCVWFTMVRMVYNGAYDLQWCVWLTMVCMAYNGVYGQHVAYCCLECLSSWCFYLVRYSAFKGLTCPLVQLES